jgi:Glucokinase
MHASRWCSRAAKASPAHVYALNDYPSLPDAIEAYLREEKPAEKPVQAVLAVASPVTGDQVTLTNHPWTFSVKALRQQLGLRRLQVVNDFAANAVAVPHLSETTSCKSAAARRSRTRRSASSARAPDLASARSCRPRTAAR